MACPLDEAIRRTADMGFDFIEISFHMLICGDKTYYWPKGMAPEHRRGIRALLKERGLRTGILIPTSQTAVPEQFAPLKIEDIGGLSDFDVGQIGSLPWMVEQALKAAADLDADLIDDIHLSFARDPDALGGVKRLMKSAEQCGVKVGIENKDERTCGEMLDALQKLQSRNAGITFDVGHAYKRLRDSESVAQLVASLGGSIIHTHIHDYTASVPHSYVGGGDINWILIIRAFKAINYQGSLTLEISPERQHVLTLPPFPDLEILRCKWILEYLLKDT